MRPAKSRNYARRAFWGPRAAANLAKNGNKPSSSSFNAHGGPGRLEVGLWGEAPANSRAHQSRSIQSYRCNIVLLAPSQHFSNLHPRQSARNPRPSLSSAPRPSSWVYVSVLPAKMPSRARPLRVPGDTLPLTCRAVLDALDIQHEPLDIGGGRSMLRRTVQLRPI